jgi:hypothetical protein
MAHLFITEKLVIKASDLPQGVAAFWNQGHLTRVLPRRRYSTLPSALMAVAQAMELQKAEEDALGLVVNSALVETCEVSSEGHCYNDVMKTLEALTDLPETTIVKVLRIIGFNVVVIEGVGFFSGAAEGRSGYLRLQRAAS